MKCLECNKFILVKRNYRNIFSPLNIQVCYECIDKNVNFTQKIVIPIEKYLINWYAICIGVPKVKNSYDFMFKDLIIKFIKEEKNGIIIILETLSVFEYNLLDQLNLGNIFLLTTYIKGEEFYEV